MTREQQIAAETQIGNDLKTCDIGLAMTSGKMRRKYLSHRKACMKAIHAMNVADGLDSVTDAELLASLIDD